MGAGRWYFGDEGEDRMILFLIGFMFGGFLSSLILLWFMDRVVDKAAETPYEGSGTTVRVQDDNGWWK